MPVARQPSFNSVPKMYLSNSSISCSLSRPLRSRARQRVHWIKIREPSVQHLGRETKTHGRPRARRYEKSPVEQSGQSFARAPFLIAGDFPGLPTLNTAPVKCFAEHLKGSLGKTLREDFLGDVDFHTPQDFLRLEELIHEIHLIDRDR